MSRRKILSMTGLPGLTDETTDEERILYFSSRISFEDMSMVRKPFFGGNSRFLCQFWTIRQSVSCFQGVHSQTSSYH